MRYNAIEPSPVIYQAGFDKIGRIETIHQYVFKKRDKEKFKIRKIYCFLQILIFTIAVIILLAALFVFYLTPRAGLYLEKCGFRSCLRILNLKCIDGVCKCPVNQYYKIGCEDKREYLQTCIGSVNNSCKEATNMICRDGICNCNLYEYWDGMVCTPKVSFGEDCINSNNCLTDRFLFCDLTTFSCACTSNRLWDGFGCVLNKDTTTEQTNPIFNVTETVTSKMTSILNTNTTISSNTTYDGYSSNPILNNSLSTTKTSIRSTSISTLSTLNAIISTADSTTLFSSSTTSSTSETTTLTTISNRTSSSSTLLAHISATETSFTSSTYIISISTETTVTSTDTSSSTTIKTTKTDTISSISAIPDSTSSTLISLTSITNISSDFSTVSSTSFTTKSSQSITTTSTVYMTSITTNFQSTTTATTMCFTGYPYLNGICYYIDSFLSPYTSACTGGYLAKIGSSEIENYFLYYAAIGTCYWIDLKRTCATGCDYASADGTITIFKNDTRICTGANTPPTGPTRVCGCYLKLTATTWCYKTATCSTVSISFCHV